MPNRIAVNTIFVVRDKKRVKIVPGQSFDFTSEELEDIKQANPEAIRLPISETAASAPQASQQSGKAGKSADKADDL